MQELREGGMGHEGWQQGTPPSTGGVQTQILTPNPPPSLFGPHGGGILGGTQWGGPEYHTSK